MANALRMGSEITRHRRALFIAVGAALVVTMVAAAWFQIYLAYKHGGLHLNSKYYQGFAVWAPRFAESNLSYFSGPSVGGWIWTGVGAAVMAGLMAARHTFVWWPLHPIGFAVSASWVLNHMWLSILCAWLIKVAVLNFGGPALYQRTRPFFMGIILGQFVAAGFWLLVDGFTGMRYNHIRVY